MRITDLYKCDDDDDDDDYYYYYYYSVFSDVTPNSVEKLCRRFCYFKRLNQIFGVIFMK
jgi:hypothetical protein